MKKTMDLVKRLSVYFMALITIVSMVVPVYASQAENQVLDGFKESLSFEAMPELASDELMNLCNYLIGEQFTETDLIENVRCCGTYANMLVESYYDSYLHDSSKDMPSYLADAYLSVNENDDNMDAQVATASISSSEKFMITYSSSSLISDLVEKANVITEIFDDVYDLYCATYGFIEPLSNRTNNKYVVSICEDLDAHGETHPRGTGYSYILIREQTIDDYMNDGTYLEGVIAHEFMHAIMFAYGFDSYQLDVDFAHEAMGQAAGIEYDITYASRGSTCSNIGNFVSNLGTSMGTVDDLFYMYGGSLFFLFLQEKYGGWDVIKTIFEYYDSSYTVFENIDSVLFFEYDSALCYAFRHFMVYCVSPDQMFELSPYNRGVQGALWGQPDPETEHNITSNVATSFSGSGSLEELSGKYYKINNKSSQTKHLVITVDYTVNDNSIPEGTFVIYNSTTDTYIYSGEVVVDNELYGVFNLTCGAQDELWMIICNAGLSGTLEYSYDIAVTNY